MLRVGFAEYRRVLSYVFGVADTVVHVTHSGRPVQCSFCPSPRPALCCPSRHSPLPTTTITTRFVAANNPPLAHQRSPTYRNPDNISNNPGRACVATNANGEQQRQQVEVPPLDHRPPDATARQGERSYCRRTAPDT
jgi:hypothetical protein